ncbi:Cytochrome C oxidase, cbb3-type, subunit III [Modicisalibacter ilicicola DSM 19980]|uniref:Cytochrome C oxidase, cbb3-type, subunit III n=1 Tax=Modicisalibacter ilicicola DSM 19980 TaxID=1121942 RepID=A0A1M4SFC8_9GAMM|nr:nitrite reductase [Halomonas ilicicola]SHE30910.1 Cytochrome C oxidase, cbb3-type, subunit III [Halomonas ilicicola DSM 19980]
MVRPLGGNGLLAVALLMSLPALAEEASRQNDIDSQALYQSHCASCHGSDRLGGMGPALLPGNLSRLKKDEAIEVIHRGRPATQMMGFGELLNDAEIDALAQWIYTPPETSPIWTMAEIKQSHAVMHPFGSLPDEPTFDADPMNLFLVVETGDHHVSLLDGDSFERIDRFPSRYALHGGPKYTPDGRYVFFGSRDGWISKYDIYNQEMVAEVRAGINMRNIAVSADGRYVMAANYLPHTLVLFEAHNLDPMKVYPVENENGESSRVSAVYAAPPRGSFIAALKDLEEVWEIPWPIPTSPVVSTGHMKEPIEALRSHDTPNFDVRRIAVPDYLDDFFFDPEYRHVIGAARGGKGAMVIDLDSGTKAADLPLAGMPHLGSGISWMHEGRRVMAIPHLTKGAVSIIDMRDWSLIKTLETAGPGFFMRSHENSPYAWVDVFFGPNHDKVHVIDKQTLEIVETLEPAPGKTAAHVEFDRHGEKLLLSIWDRDGAVIVYDAKTLDELERIPMDKPSGKYNVWNKTHYEEGTSH